MEIDVNDSKRPDNRNSKAIKALLILFCVLIVGAGIAVYVLYGMVTSDDTSCLFINPEDTHAVIAASDKASKAPETIKYNGETYTRNENVVNLVFLGVDTSEERQEEEMGYRTDMIMLCAVDVKAKKSHVVLRTA